MKSITRITCFLILALTAGLIVGCQHPRPADPVQPTEEALLIPKDDMDIAWDETLEVLREHYFIPDRQDRREGMIVSSPDLSKQWFEFWRDDTVGKYEVSESSIQSIQRIATVNFIPQGREIQIRVEVAIQRKNQPQRQITTSSGTFLAFREQMPLIVTGSSAERADVITWVDLGKDVKMSNYLLSRIERRLPDAQVMFIESHVPATTQPVEK